MMVLLFRFSFFFFSTSTSTSLLLNQKNAPSPKTGGRSSSSRSRTRWSGPCCRHRLFCCFHRKRKKLCSVNYFQKKKIEKRTRLRSIFRSFFSSLLPLSLSLFCFLELIVVFCTQKRRISHLPKRMGGKNWWKKRKVVVGLLFLCCCCCWWWWSLSPCLFVSLFSSLSTLINARTKSNKPKLIKRKERTNQKSPL